MKNINQFSWMVGMMFLTAISIGHANEADSATDAHPAGFMRLIESRKQMDDPSNWNGLMKGSFTSASFDADGSASILTGKYVVAYSEDCCLIEYRIRTGEKGVSLKCLVKPDMTVSLCNGALPVRDVASLPFDPYLIVQRPYIVERNRYGLGDFWENRLSWIDYEEEVSGQASVSMKYNDSKLVYVVETSDEHRGRVLSMASHDGSLSTGYHPKSSYRIDYSYDADGLYPDKVCETWQQWYMPEGGPLSQRLEKSTSLTVEFRTTDFQLDECGCESAPWEAERGRKGSGPIK
jgi:hypothetical protein